MKEKVRNLLSGWIEKYKNNFFLRKLSSLLAVDILVKLSAVILLPIYLWLMTQEEYGIYSYILSIIATFSVILNFGLYVSQSKYYSDTDSPERKKIVLFNIFILLTALLIMVLVPVYAFRFDYILVRFLFKNEINYKAYRWLILIAVLLTVYALILTNYFITSEKIKQFRRYNLFRLILINIVVIAALYFIRSDNINTRLAFTYFTESGILFIFFYFYIKEMLPRFDKKIMLMTLKLGIPIMFSAMWGLLSNYSDKFFLEKYGTPRDLSHYYLAFSIANLLYMICAAVQNAWLPTFLKEKDLEKNVQETKKLMRNLFQLMIILSVLLTGGLYIVLKLNIISIQYWPAIYILPILLLAQAINGILVLYSNYTIYFEKTHWSLFISIVASIIGLACSILLIPAWNIFGAAIVYLLVQLTYLVIYYLVVKHKLNTVILRKTSPDATSHEIL